MKVDSATGAGGAERGTAAAELPFSHMGQIFAPGSLYRHGLNARLMRERCGPSVFDETGHFHVLPAALAHATAAALSR